MTASSAAPTTSVATERFPRLAALLVAVLAAAYTLPMVVDSFSATKEFRPISEPSPPTPQIVDRVTLLSNVAVLAVCVLVIALRIRNLRRLIGPVLLLLVAWGWAVIGLVVSDADIPRSVALIPLILVAMALSRPDRLALEALGWATFAVAGLSLVMGAFFPDAGRYARPESLADDKFVWGLGILAGPFPSGNNLGLALAVGLPSVFFLPRRWQRVAGAAACAVALFWTFSRTSWLAALAGVAVWLLLTLLPRRRRLAAAVSLGLLGAVAVVLPFLTSDPTAYSNRGHLWVAGVETWLEKPLTGWGASYYLQIPGTADDLGNFAYHAHNQTVHLLVTGGIVLFALVGAAFAWAAVASVRDAAAGFLWPAAAMAALLASAIVEVPLGIVDRTMFYPSVMLTLLMILTFARADRRTDAGGALA